MDAMSWSFLRSELSEVFSNLIGEEVNLSEEEARRVVEKLCHRDASLKQHAGPCADLVGSG